MKNAKKSLYRIGMDKYLRSEAVGLNWGPHPPGPRGTFVMTCGGFEMLRDASRCFEMLRARQRPWQLLSAECKVQADPRSLVLLKMLIQAASKPFRKSSCSICSMHFRLVSKLGCFFGDLSCYLEVQSFDICTVLQMTRSSSLREIFAS